MKIREQVVVFFFGLSLAAFLSGTTDAQHSHPIPDRKEGVPRSAASHGRTEPLQKKSDGPLVESGIDLRIERGKVKGGTRVIRVTQGDTVRLRWTTDKTIAIHLHGYDVEITAKPDAPAVMSFKADAAGRFPISSHDTGGLLHTERQGSGKRHHEAVLLYLEVYPR